MPLNTSLSSLEYYWNQALDKSRQFGRSGVCDPGARRDGVVSVVTVSFNSAATIGKTIDSVKRQTYRAIEYIVVDGGSSDSTLDILHSHGEDIDLWVSEPDRGISDAFNKGIALASGEYVAIVNSDDWLEPDHLRIAVEELQRTNADFVFGDLMLHSKDGEYMNLFVGEPEYGSRIAHYMPYLNHPTVVCRYAAFERVGLFDVSLKTAMDYDWLLRLHLAGGVGRYTPQIVGHMTLEGESDRNYVSALREMRDISIHHGYPRFPAWCRYGFRLLKGSMRRGLQAMLPAGLYESLRRLINGNFRGAERGA